MKFLFSNILLLFITFIANGQNSIKGVVADKLSQATLPGANIYFPDLKKGATTDLEGFYEIKDLPSGTFLVEISYLGYSTQLIKTAIKGEVRLDVELAPTAAEMSEVVITGTSLSTERKLNPIPTIVINKLSSYENSATNIIDAIAKQPGVSQITTGPSISKPVIRGLGYNRVVVLNNNIRQEGQQWGDEHGIEIDEYSIEKVEIIKGPGSLIYGSDAMAGVINFIQPQPVDEGKIIGNIHSNYQSNNNLVALSGMTAGNINSINWLARVTGKKAGNFQNAYDGKVFNSGYDELAFTASAGVSKKWGFSQLLVSNFSQNLGLVEGERDSLGNFTRQVAVNDSTVEDVVVTNKELNSYDIDVPYQKINQLMVSTNNKFFFGNSGLIVNLAYQQNTRKEFGNPLAVDEAELYFKLNTVNYEFRYLLPVYKGWETSAGISGMWQSSRNLGNEFLIPEYNLFDGGLFVFIQKNMKNLHLSGGIRLDMREVNSKDLYLDSEGNPVAPTDTSATQRFTSFESFFSNFSWSLGASYDLSEHFIVKLNLARGFRAPNISELGSNGVHEGTFHYEIGNPDLNEETSFQTDAGLIYDSEHVSFELAGFVNSIQNFIFLEKLSSTSSGDSIVDPSDPVPAYKFVQGNSVLYGGEVSLDIHPHPLDWLHFENSFSYVRGIQLGQPDSSMNLPQIPAPRFQTELRADIKKWGKHLKNVYANVAWEYNLAQNFVYLYEGTETPTPAYNLLSAGIGGDIANKQGNTICTLTFTANNILNMAYQNHLSRLKYLPENPATGRMGVYIMGRNFSVNVIFPLNFRN
ncbi:MAG TPA: TonB-dependent receptor [Bacteroidales bacterium]